VQSDIQTMKVRFAGGASVPLDDAMFCLLCFCSVLSLDEKFFYKEMMVKGGQKEEALAGGVSTMIRVFLRLGETYKWVGSGLQCHQIGSDQI
jgi:hypothetical protein